MTHFGQLLRSLRAERGISQDGLASLANLHRATIMEAEKRKDCRLNPASLVMIVHAFSAAGKPLSAEEVGVFSDAAGLDARVAERLVSQTQGASVPTPRLTPTSDLERLIAALQHTPHVSPTAQLAGQLVTLVGDAAAQSLLRSLIATINAAQGTAHPSSPANSPEPRALRVAHPPVQRDGYTEQTEVEYDVNSSTSTDPPAVPIAKPKPRRPA